MAAQFQIEGITAFITGANRGIGKAIASQFAKAGANLFLYDRQTDQLAGIVDEAQALGVKVLHQQGDVTSPEQVEQAVAAAEDGLGPIDVLVNGAGICQSIRFLDYTLEDWNRLMEVNVAGTFLCSQAALRRMTQRGRGKIINLASIAGRIGSKYRASYNASKHAVIGLTRCLAVEFADDGITANAICPGMVDTEMFAGVVAGDAEISGVDQETMLGILQQRALQKRLLRPEEIAGLALFLASPASDGMTGQALTYSGGIVMQ
ncbi:MAG: SDR family oxidoreductase [SAR324 cluster bacterium]|nr:SDR family oxidoreductase [SAR324 cluster bacterium]MCZ6533039.1 SDR family oxidoreductase [SAR324 cluster bacterium]MCZ6646378.1 SDR family oxidoreductase [SAR324 cluster bacterium]MCZ6728868.1 SDR family oxidoreductase [SAR324 cluster bacterium]